MSESVAPTCPFLGLKEDRTTLIGFPSTGNFCFHCKTPTVPQMDHQESYCLKATHVDCVVFNQTEKQLFPPALKATDVQIPTPASRFPIIQVTFIVVILVILFTGWHYRSFFENADLTKSTPFPIKSVETATLHPTEELAPLILPTIDLPTSLPTLTYTPVPTLTLVLDQKHGLDVPILVDGNTFIVHKVLQNENFEILIKTYNTSREVIRAINYLLPNSLWVNLPLILSPGMTTVHPKLPTFEAYLVTDAAVSIDDLGVQKKVNGTLLRQFNNCPNGCILHEGDWVLLPHPQ